MDQILHFYIDFNSSTWPINYIYNRSECIDSNGTIISVDVKYENNNIIINTSKTVYCTIYFDRDTKSPKINNFYIIKNPTPQYTNEISGKVNVTMTWEDSDVSSYCINTSATTNNCEWLPIDNVKQIIKEITLSEGRNNIYGYIKDKAENISGVKEGSIILDTKAPVVTNAVDNNPQENSLSIVITANDINNNLEVSGIDKYCYARSDSNNTQDYICNTISTITISELQPGTSYDFWIYATDKALNGSPANRKKFTITTKSKPAKDVVIDNATGQIQESPVEGDTLRRFQGDASIVKNNYICFGTSDQTTCKENQGTYMYRILGVDTETNQLKIIKKETLDTSYKWHSIDGDNSYTWNNVMLFKQLNGINTGDSSYPSNIFLSNTTYVPNKYIVGNSGSKWADAIETYRWSYGDVPFAGWAIHSGINATRVLEYEKTVWKNGSGTSGTVDAKIGLMYLSDYYLAVSNTADCMNYYDEECEASWIFIWNNDTEWTMTRNDINSAWYVYISGETGTANVTNSNAVRPVFYLKSTIVLDGTGEITDPYRITGIS